MARADLLCDLIQSGLAGESNRVMTTGLAGGFNWPYKGLGACYD